MFIINKIGIKSIKITLAVIISLLIGHLFKLDSPYLTAINALIAIQSTIYDSVSFGKNRILGTLIGASIGIIIVTFIHDDFIITSIGIFIIIYVCNMLKLKSSIVVAISVCLSIIIFPSPNYSAINATVSTTISTTIGVLIAIIVNSVLSPFELISNINNSYYDLKQNIFSLYIKIFTTDETIDTYDFNSKVMNFKSLVNSYNNEYFKIKDKKLKYQQVKTLFENVDGISFFIAVIIELRENNLNEVNVNRSKKFFHHDIKALNYKESHDDDLFNFHVDKLLDYLEAIENV
ncbi:hypothetical protein DIC82_11825 [Clostridium beijerinckii]|nr:hypothetical protein DIC82_11825 [Clostridium beijerinckii]